MFREMRRKDRIMPEEEALALLEKGEYGTLATCGEDGAPYAVPLSYVLLDGGVYFHCAKAGQKIDNLHHEKRVCFSVVGKTQPIYDRDFTTLYESVIVQGQAEEVLDEDEKKQVLLALCQKYLPAHMDKAADSIQKSRPATGIWKIHILHLTGKHKQG